MSCDLVPGYGTVRDGSCKLQPFLLRLQLADSRKQNMGMVTTRRVMMSLKTNDGNLFSFNVWRLLSARNASAVLLES